MPFRKGCRHYTSLDAWHQFQTVRLHWLSRAFVHLLARHTLLSLLLFIIQEHRLTTLLARDFRLKFIHDLSRNRLRLVSNFYCIMRLFLAWEKNDVFSLMTFYFTPRWTWNGSKKIAGNSFLMMSSNKQQTSAFLISAPTFRPQIVPASRALRPWFSRPPVPFHSRIPIKYHPKTSFGNNFRRP